MLRGWTVEKVVYHSFIYQIDSARHRLEGATAGYDRVYLLERYTTTSEAALDHIFAIFELLRDSGISRQFIRGMLYVV